MVSHHWVRSWASLWLPLVLLVGCSLPRWWVWPSSGMFRLSLAPFVTEDALREGQLGFLSKGEKRHRFPLPLPTWAMFEWGEGLEEADMGQEAVRWGWMNPFSAPGKKRHLLSVMPPPYT